MKRLRDMKIISATASSATAFEFCPGVFITTIPRSEAAARSTLSYPAPARTTIRRRRAAAITSAVTLSLRTISASASATASSNCALSVYFSSNASSPPASSTISRIPSTAFFAKGFSVATNIFILFMISMFNSSL